MFFDYENIVYSLRNRFEQKANFEALMNKAREFGTIAAAEVFADWSLPYMSPALMYALQAAGFDLIFVPTGSTQANSPRKNVADLYMAIAVMDCLYARPDVDTFMLLTGDRDFMPLVNHLKRKGKRVVAIGVDGSSSYYLTQSVDDFFYYSEVEEIYEEKPRRLKGRPTNIYDALVQAVRIINERGGSPRLTNLKPVMIDLLDGFDEKEYADSKGRKFQKFKDFVQEAQRRGMVRIFRRGNSVEVHLPNQPVSFSNEDSSSAKAIELDEAHRLLVLAVRKGKDDNRTRVSSIRNRMGKLHKGFDVANIKNEKGEPGFEKFNDFLKDAAEAGLIHLDGSGQRMEVNLGAKAPEVAEETEAAPALQQLTGTEARSAIVNAMRAYQSYPTSFLSLAGFVHKHNEGEGVAVDEELARELMTEAVQGDLLRQIVLQDGRRSYELNNDPAVGERFLGVDVAEVETLEDSDEEGDSAETKPTPPTDPFEALVGAVQSILQSGKDPVLPRVKTTMINMLGSFNEKELTDTEGNSYQRFKDFVIDGENRGVVRLKQDGAKTRVFLPDQDEAASELTEPATQATVQTATEDAQLESSEPAVDDIIDETVLEAVEEATPLEATLEQAAADALAAVQEVPPVKDTGNLTNLSEEEQRELIVDALGSFKNYPAPFMAILGHCRDIRNNRQVLNSGECHA